MTRPLDLIVCGVCHGELGSPESDGASLACRECRRIYPTGEVLDLTPVPPPDADVQAQWSLWEHLQENFLVAANEIPEDNLSVTTRQDVQAFAAFCDLRGNVLDIGCGPQRLPSYADVTQCRFVGLDPVAGEPVRDFDFVKGVGEYLPFAVDSFDQVLFATSLDHMLVPRRALAEAKRVTRPGGAVNVWFGEIDRPPAGGIVRRATNAARLAAGTAVVRLRGQGGEPPHIAALEHPKGAIDKFHALHNSVDQVTGWFADVGLELSAVERIDFNVGCFIRGTA